MNSRHAVTVPPLALAGAAAHAEHRRAVALLAEDGPLTADDRQVLERSLLWWEESRVTAEQQVRAIAARLGGHQPTPSASVGAGPRSQRL